MLCTADAFGTFCSGSASVDIAAVSLRNAFAAFDVDVRFTGAYSCVQTLVTTRGLVVFFDSRSYRHW